jgi:hypothetical protein
MPAPRTARHPIPVCQITTEFPLVTLSNLLWSLCRLFVMISMGKNIIPSYGKG